MALVLTRRRGSGFTIEVPEAAGGSTKIHIFVSSVQGGQCQVAINAAQHVTIVRDELLEESALPAPRGGRHG
jgi:sRNA-binding carbon storage regulator CsrA